jgi:hypothetical protein
VTVPPLASEAEARALPQVRAIYDALRPSDPPGTMAQGTAAMLSETLVSCAVRFGAYDSRILTWLAGWDVQVVAVICGWIERAYESGKQAGSTGEGT